MDAHSPIPTRPSHSHARVADADRVDVRGLLNAVAGRYMLIGAFAVGFAVLLYVASGLLPASYGANAKVMLNQRNVPVMSSNAVVSSAGLSEPVILSEMSVMRSNVLIGDLIDKLGVDRLETHFFGAPRPDAEMANRKAALTDMIREDLTVRREGQSYVVSINYKGGDPQLVAELTNGIADTYIATQLADRRESVLQATSWIQEQAAAARVELERAEAAVAERRQATLARDGSSYDTTNQQLANLNSQLVVARSDRVAAEAEYDQLKALLARQGAQGLAKAVTSPLLESLVKDRVELQRKDAEWARTFEADHPQRVRLAKEISDIDAQLATEAQRVIELKGNAVKVAQLREDSLSKGITDLEESLAGISENTVGLRQAEREAQAAQQNYEALMARLSAATGQDKLQRPEAKIIERATVPGAPASPKPKLLGVFGGLLGLTIGIAAALFLEMTRSTYRGRREVEADTGVKVLAALPRVNGRNSRDVILGLRNNSNTIFGERIRQLRTFLFMRNGFFEKRVILVASSQPDEGKSLTALALAEMAVLAGKSVILVDADLRRSRMVKTFGWKLEHDLNDFILERADLAESIYTDDELGINVLTASEPCPEAADELNTEWLRPMMEELKRVYDVVVIDSPPLLKVADGLVLARVADSIVYVVRWDSTPRSAVHEGLDALSEMDLNVTGIVLSQVDPKVAEKSYGEGYAGYA